MKQLLKKTNTIIFQKLLFALLIFTIPSNLFKTFLENSSYVNGLRVDYLIPKLHLSDLLVLLLLIFLALIKKNRQVIITTWNNIKHKNLLTLLLGIFFIFQLSTQYYLVSVMFFTRIMILIKLGIILKNNKQILTSKITSTAVSITLIFQSLLAWFQYLNQKSLLDYYFFGETQLNSYAGIAKSSFLGIQKILPYGTTAHPNVLGGILAIFALIHLNTTSQNLKYKRANLFIFLLAASAVLLTQSVSAILAITIGSLIIFLSKKTIFPVAFKFKKNITLKTIGILFLLSNFVIIGFLSLPKFENTNSFSISRRAYLNDAAVNITANNIFTGIGLKNFTANVEKYTNNREVVRFVQPAHNVLLLLLAETGLIGITTTMLVLIPQLRKNKSIKHPEYLIALIPIMIFDHYLITLQSGILLLFLSLVITDSEI